MDNFEKVIPIKLKSINDLVRLAATISSPQAMIYILKFIDNNKLIIGVLGVFRDYYKLYGLPMFYYYSIDVNEAKELLNANYIIISTNDEKIEFSKHPKPGLSIPLITLDKKPPFIPDLD